jgi:hypothetical protein
MVVVVVVRVLRVVRLLLVQGQGLVLVVLASRQISQALQPTMAVVVVVEFTPTTDRHISVLCRG